MHSNLSHSSQDNVCEFQQEESAKEFVGGKMNMEIVIFFAGLLYTRDKRNG